ncbi:DUF6713 family protein [Sunxiuqinia sp. A32]|uniref:DUF6713 family protein n=1 Tax=Sunxiuqinia sp. A32 TaxID=3461496 RepID=UPI00404636A2
MQEFLFWIYLINATILINHEIESAYWEEWKLFKIPGKLTGYILIHLPLIFIILLGVIELFKESILGYSISLFVGASGIFAYFIHHYFTRKGEEGFDLIISRFLLMATLLLSIIQLVFTIYLLGT